MKELTLTDLSPEAVKGLDRLYHTTRDPRLRTRAQMVLLSAERSLPAEEVAAIVRTHTETVRRWLKRYLERGLDGLIDAPRPGGPRKVTDAYLVKLVVVAHQPPSAVGLPDTQWTAQRLAEYMALHTGVKVHPETVRLHLRAAGIDLEEPHAVTPAAKPPEKGRASGRRLTSKKTNKSR